ncbi:MAG: hypothetical protein WBB45_09575 [Cyclobacteriaceae bacterium]
MRHLILALLSLILIFSCQSEDDFKPNLLSLEKLDEKPIYKSIYEGKQSPDSVYRLVFRDTSFSEIPKDITNFRNLQYLNCSNKNLERLNPKTLINLVHLKYLAISRNPIKSLPEEIENLKYLKILFINETEIEALPQAIFSLDSLQYIHVGESPIPLYELKKLKTEKPDLEIILGYAIEYDTTMTQEKLDKLYDQAIEDMM